MNKSRRTVIFGAKGSWTLGGYYNHTLARINGRWKVTEIKMTWTWKVLVPVN
ncbi:hypothetical protein [Dulcicalothrix desertica]|uniref:hypothetical protein n=1 Tax=Dulcicalothrix desertica TaxID=32056 RepID=UPI0011990243|nr:hypothetical protein [Dulcicalothrix desertica]TWH40192.1 hypothetical protein CAL7102_09496 [Dulcicalothrix desertica PCC 7102]